MSADVLHLFGEKHFQCGGICGRTKPASQFNITTTGKYLPWCISCEKIYKKICNTCNKEKSLDSFSPILRSEDGRNSICKNCQSIKFKEGWRRKKEADSGLFPESEKEVRSVTKSVPSRTIFCSTCKHDKPETEFSSDKRQHDKSTCRECKSSKDHFRRQTKIQSSGSKRARRMNEAAILILLLQKSGVYHIATKTGLHFPNLNQLEKAAREKIKDYRPEMEAILLQT